MTCASRLEPQYTITRRQLLLGGLLALLPNKNILALPVSLEATTPSLEDTLAAFLDTLLPNDELGPSASMVGITGSLLKDAEESPLFAKLLTNGCAWLNAQSSGSYVLLPVTYKAQLVSWMEKQAPKSTIPSLFYTHIRYRALSYYFAMPEIQTSFGLPSPPQPAGYNWQESHRG